MQTAQEAFKVLLNQVVAPTLKARGFVRQGQAWFLRQDGNWGIVGFQKSTFSTAQQVKFTINLGVNSGRLSAFFRPVAPRGPGGRPPASECHWCQRIGYLLPERQDTWWTIRSNVPNEQLADQLRAVIDEVAVPAIQQHLGDEQLRDLWLAEASHRVASAPLLKLAVLLKALGPRDRYEEVVHELRRSIEGKPNAAIVEPLLKRLEGERVS